MTTPHADLPDTVAQQVHQHLEASYAGLILSHDGTASRAVRDLRRLVHVLNATAAYAISLLGEADRQTAADAVSYIADAFDDDEHLGEWVTEQLVNRGVDLADLAEKAKASAALGDIARALLDQNELQRTRAALERATGRQMALVGILGDLLRGPWESGHPGYAAVRTHWIREEKVSEWRTLLPTYATPATLATGGHVTAGPVMGEGGCVMPDVRHVPSLPAGTVVVVSVDGAGKVRDALKLTGLGDGDEVTP